MDRSPYCGTCGGSGWVCEAHPVLPFEHGDCDGAGEPCVCNPDAEVDWREVHAKAGGGVPGEGEASTSREATCDNDAG